MFAGSFPIFSEFEPEATDEMAGGERDEFCVLIDLPNGIRITDG